MMTIRFDGYIDKDGSVSLTTPKWLVDRVSKAVEEEYDVIMGKEGDGKGQEKRQEKGQKKEKAG
jgi:hypothetical protein